MLCVQRRTPDDGQRNCPKHVEFYSKNKFEKSVHLVGFIIRIHHAARSPVRQNVFYYPIIWYTNQITTLYFNCNAEASTSVPPFPMTAALPVNGREYQPKHVVADMTNK